MEVNLKSVNLRLRERERERDKVDGAGYRIVTLYVLGGVFKFKTL